MLVARFPVPPVLVCCRCARPSCARSHRAVDTQSHAEQLPTPSHALSRCMPAHRAVELQDHVLVRLVARLQSHHVGVGACPQAQPADLRLALDHRLLQATTTTSQSNAIGGEHRRCCSGGQGACRSCAAPPLALPLRPPVPNPPPSTPPLSPCPLQPAAAACTTLAAPPSCPTASSPTLTLPSPTCRRSCASCASRSSSCRCSAWMRAAAAATTSTPGPPANAAALALALAAAAALASPTATADAAVPEAPPRMMVPVAASRLDAEAEAPPGWAAVVSRAGLTWDEEVGRAGRPVLSMPVECGRGRQQTHWLAGQAGGR